MFFNRSGIRPSSAPRTTAAVLALTLVLSSCGANDDISSGSQDYVQGDGTETVFPPGERLPAPDVSGETLDGDPVSLSDYRGDVLVINIWASWCAPCRTEIPVLKEVYSDHTDEGLAFLGVNIKDNRTAALAFERNLEMSYPSIYDQPGEVLLAFRDTVPPRAIPSTIVIDRQGDIAARVVGEVTYLQLTDLVEPVLVEPTGEDST